MPFNVAVTAPFAWAARDDAAQLPWSPPRMASAQADREPVG
jgi:hypothetical protein